MAVKDFEISNRYGQPFFATEWSPDGDSRGLIVLIHGLSDHARRYHHAGSFFSSSGYHLIIFDLRGNGRSFGKRGHFPSLNIMLDDISLFLEEAKKQHPGLPLVLYGHSMGGNLVLNYLIRKMPAIAGAVVTSPWLRLTLKPPAYRFLLARMINRTFPALTLPDEIVPACLSHDKEVERSYAVDPLVHHRISVRAFIEISQAGEYALKHAGKIGCPLLLMHGTEDSLTSFAASKELSKKVLDRHTFRAWEGLFHELHNEHEKEAVLGFIRDWTDHLLFPGPG